MNRSSIFGNVAWCVYICEYVCMGAAYGFTPGLERVWIALDSEVSLRLKSALPQAGVTATHIKSSIFSVSFSSIFKRCHPQILWEVNFLFVNVVRGRADWVVSRRIWSLWKFANIFKLLLDWIHLEMMQLWWPEPSFRFSFWSQRLIFWRLLQN